MSFYEKVRSKEYWEAFLEQEETQEFPDHLLVKDIKQILAKEQYNEFTPEFLANYEIPLYKELTKYNSSKKRIVYVYPGIYRTILKLTSYYMLQQYSHKFCSNSLAYTLNKSTKTAFNILKSFNITKKDKIHKNDFTDYFNTIPIHKLEPKLKNFLQDDLELYTFIMNLLENDKVRKGKSKRIVEMGIKGVMAGSPIAGILANIYMNDVDYAMQNKKYKYIRYADDTLIIGDKALEYFKEQIAPLDIKFNEKKSQVYNINTGVIFLGFIYVGNKIDISPDAFAKMKSRFKRRAKWYTIWAKKNNIQKEVALYDYITKINQKLYTDLEDTINWSRWYLPCINTTESIEKLDKLFIASIRYLYSGTYKRTKKHYALSYEAIKSYGYRSLVNEYYKIRRTKNIKNKAII